MLDLLWTALKPPPHANVGETYTLHQSLAAFYYLRTKSLLFEAHCQSPDLKHWWQSARTQGFEKYIDQHVALMHTLGIPLPPSLPEMTVLTDQFMAVDGAAMVKGMMEAHIRGLHAARRPDIALLFRQMLDGAMAAGAQLLPIIEREGWLTLPPPYPSAPHEK